MDLLNSVASGYVMWGALESMYGALGGVSDEIRQSSPEAAARDKLLQIYTLLESALELRTEIEFGESRQTIQKLNFYEKMALLGEKGVDLRSVVWNALVHYQSCLACTLHDGAMPLSIFAEIFDSSGYFTRNPLLGPKRPHIFSDTSSTVSVSGAIRMAMDELGAIMHLLCFDEWERRYLGA